MSSLLRFNTAQLCSWYKTSKYYSGKTICG